MKSITLCICFFFLFIACHGQHLSSITSKDPKPKAGKENIYYYKPYRYFKTPDKIYASLVYKKGDSYYFENTHVDKVDGIYRFSYKAPDSTQVMVLSITDQDKEPVDNNNEVGFNLYFANKKGNVPATAYIDATELLSYYAQLTLRLNTQKLRIQMINLFEKAYALSPSLKAENPYRYYLTLLYRERKEAVIEQLYNYASQMAAAKNDEAKWMNAIYIYRSLRMNGEQQEIEKKAVETYPSGMVAQDKFLDDVDSDSALTEQLILLKMDDYIYRFRDTSAKMKNCFYGKMIEVLLNKGEWTRLPRYEDLIIDKRLLTNLYNSYAQNWSDGNEDSSITELNIARMISGKTLNMIRAQMANTASVNDDGLLQKNFKRYAITYAQILYRLGEYDSAFYYQHAAYSQTQESNIGFLEQYAMYAEKAKGENFAYQFIVEQLLKGVHSNVMLTQLKSLSLKLNIPDTQYILIKNQYAKVSKEKTTAEIKSKFGTIKSVDFNLRNLAGAPVALSSFKTKVVVLSFWASWCGPCITSFPKMQKIVNTYKEDNNVVFLFIDTWEPKGKANSNSSMQKKAFKFMKDNNYSFQVLLDENDAVANMYKVNAVPSKFIIDKRGNIVFMGDTSDLSQEIENAKN